MQKLVEKLKQARHCVAFTGAGSSTLAGIRDFRGERGLYKEFDAEKLFHIDSFKRDPAYFYKHAKKLFYELDKKEPCIVHTECARLEKAGIIKRIITQNIDMLHQKAGSQHIIELHGSPYIHYCLSCHREFSFSRMKELLETDDVPYCDKCGGLIKPNTIFFGEQLPIDAIQAATNEAKSADLMLVLGSSLLVQPAASLPVYTARNGGEIVIVNNQTTPLDHLASLKYGSLEEVFEFLREHLT